MTVETTTRPLIVVEDLRPARHHPQRMRRRRVVAVLTVGAAASLGGAGVIGSPQLGVVGAVLALTLALYAAQLLRLRAATVRRELDALQATGWADDDLSTWPTVTAAEIGRRGEAAPPADAGTPPLVARPPRLMDRWAVTQVVWAGVLGCCYNALATLAERLSQGSSLPWLRARLLLVTGRLLARLSGQSWRRTVAISALATASSTGLFVAGTGPIGTAMAGAAQVRGSTAAASGTQGTAATAPAPSAHRAARATAPALAEGTSSYTVRTGDTLWGIAQRFGTTVGALAATNGLADPTLIYPGQVFTVPRGGAASAAARATTGAQTPAEGTSSYTVRTGDTLWGIAQRFGTTVGALAAANGLADPALIYAGQVLAMPQGGAASDATASLTAATGAAPAAPTAASAVTSAPAPTAPVAAVPLAAPAATSAPAPAPAPAATSAPAPAPAPAATSAPAPAPAATSAPATAAAPSSYTVQPGDTLATIAQRFGTTVGALAAANGIADPTVLDAGQVLTISGPGAPAAPAAPSGGATATLTSASTSASTSAASGTTSPSGQAAVQAAESQLGVPYSWGGETAGVGFDCSGLAQWAWSQAGVAIPRTSQAQWTAVPHVSLSNLQPGDLLFYYNLDGTGTVDHVAIYVGSGPDGSQTIIQAPYTGTTVSFAALYTTGLIGAGQP